MINSKLIGGILLISGITIGAGMLALPVSTGLGGFYPALVIFLLCWFFLLWTAFLILEVNLLFEGEVNLISMAKRTLGAPGAAFTWLCFLLLLYSLLAAYMAASGPLFIESIDQLIGIELPGQAGPFVILALFGPFIYFGLQSVDLINRMLMFGLVATYCVLVVFLGAQVKLDYIAHVDFDYMLISLPVVFTAFGYHVIIPSLVNYLDRDVPRIKLCIIFGSLIPFAVYLVWEFLIVGNVPVAGSLGLADMLDKDITISQALEAHLENRYITGIMGIFSVFAIVTSFVGVSQGLFDFLRDGLKVERTYKGRLFAFLLTFVPPLIFVVGFQKGFVAVLEYAGVFVALLLALLPIGMVYSKRFIQKTESPYKAPGGRVLMLLGTLAVVLLVVLVMGKNMGWLTYDLEPYL